MRALVGLPFSCGTRPGRAETNWSVAILSPVSDTLSPLRVSPVFLLDDLCDHNLLWACPKRHGMHSRKSFFNFWNFLGSMPNLDTNNITDNSKWKSLWWRLRNSCCNREKLIGKTNFSKSSPDNVSVADLYLGTDNGIHPISGLLGNIRCSLVVTMPFPLLPVTVIQRTLFSSGDINFTFTVQDKPPLVWNNVLPTLNISSLIFCGLCKQVCSTSLLMLVWHKQCLWWVLVLINDFIHKSAIQSWQPKAFINLYFRKVGLQMVYHHTELVPVPVKLQL